MSHVGRPRQGQAFDIIGAVTRAALRARPGPCGLPAAWSLGSSLRVLCSRAGRHRAVIMACRTRG